jgi:hypothetical protein
MSACLEVPIANKFYKIGHNYKFTSGNPSCMVSSCQEVAVGKVFANDDKVAGLLCIAF